MSHLPQAPSKRLLALHGWSGTLLGLFLYVVVVTGTVAVLANEIAQWSASASGRSVLQPGVDATVKRLAAELDPAAIENVRVFATPTGNTFIYFWALAEREDGRKMARGTQFVVDPNTQQVQKRYDGWSDELPFAEESSALEHFIANLHIRLHAPNPWGIFATGILGFVMLIAVVTGVLLHKHLIKELLLTPRFKNPLLTARDRHILAGSWSLPFGFVLAFTGTFYSFAGSLTIPAVAYVAFGGDIEALQESVIGGTLPEDTTPSGLADLDAMIIEATERTGTAPIGINITHFGRADALVELHHGAADGALSGETVRHEGASGSYLGPKPFIGNEPSLGNSLVMLIGPLHFGNFAGLLSKLVWFSLGVALSYVTLTGMRLWTARRAEDPKWAWMERAVVTFGYGTCIAMAGAAVGFFPGLVRGAAESFTAWGFSVTAVGAMLFGMLWPTLNGATRVLRAVLGVALIVLPALRIIFGGAGWAKLLSDGSLIVMALDLTLLVGGIACLWLATRPSTKAISLTPEVAGATG